MGHGLSMTQQDATINIDLVRRFAIPAAAAETKCLSRLVSTLEKDLDNRHGAIFLIAWYQSDEEFTEVQHCELACANLTAENRDLEYVACTQVKSYTLIIVE